MYTFLHITEIFFMDNWTLYPQQMWDMRYHQTTNADMCIAWALHIVQGPSNVSQTDFGETLFLGTPGFKKMDEFSKYSSIFQNPDVP